MNDSTPAQPQVTGPESEKSYQVPAARHAPQDKPQRIVVAATFTADLLQEPLRFWMQKLDIPAEIVCAPYAQLMQELLNPDSACTQNRRGFNVLLIRLEDWIRDRRDEAVARNLEHLRAAVQDLAVAVELLRARSSAAIFIYFCPPSISLTLVYRTELDKLEQHLGARLSQLAHTHCWQHLELARMYHLETYEDPFADRIGHIPYTQEYFVAVATLLARRIAALTKPPYKVIAVDCDNTLWSGVCGEDGPNGIEITGAHLELQEMLVRQHDAGVLLCLCSKNSWSDVQAVFRGRSEMPLREEHFICSRVNWNAKSANLTSLASELDLSLDSFIFIDDSAVECSEVRAHCPAVLTLQLPPNPHEGSHFIAHVWAFDRIGVSAEASQRTLQYRQNRARNKAREEASDLTHFLASLELQVDVSPMQRQQLARVAELVQRTNQFNVTGVRRHAGEIEALCSCGELTCLVVHVRDRFGDYGLVGALLLRREPDALVIDTFVLSCRVLGRAVEEQILAEVGRMASTAGLSSVSLTYRPTSRNTPARTFLEQSFKQFRVSAAEIIDPAGGSIFEIPVYATVLKHDHAVAVHVIEDVARPDRAEATAAAASVPHWHEAASSLSRIEDIVREIYATPLQRRGKVASEYAAPETPEEVALAAIWCDVLRLERVGTRDDFFELGGDSILAVRVLAKIGAAFGREVAIAEFFELPTIEETARRLADARACAADIQRGDSAIAAPLSSSQQRLWFIYHLEHGGTAYHVPLVLRLRGDLDTRAMQSALDAVLQRHDVLRAVFIEIEGEPWQRTVPQGQFVLRIFDLRALAAPERAVEVQRQAREELTTAFDLRTGPLIRGRLLQLSDSEHILQITVHHIASDGWSLGVFMSELSALYAAYLERRPNPLPPLSIQYADWARRQREDLHQVRRHEQLEYWKVHLDGAPELLSVPTDRPRPPAQSYRGAGAPIALDARLTQALKVLSRATGVTLAMTLHAAWSVVLARLSSEQDVVVGIPVANRLRCELEPLIGFFVNTLAVRVTVVQDLTITELLHQVRDIMVGAYAHQDVPFEQVVEMLQPARSLSRSPIFQVMFVLQNAPQSAPHFPGLALQHEEVPPLTAQFDLTLELQESAEGLRGYLIYATDLFDASTVERWTRYLLSALEAFVRDPQRTISSIDMMDGNERRRVTELFNATQAAYPQGRLIHQLFEDQVGRTPDSIAVTCDGQTLTYAALNCRSNQLARRLIARGVAPHDYVAVLMTRSIEMLIAQLAVLKSGGVYVPIDPEMPAARRVFMIRDCNARVIIGQQPADLDCELEQVQWLAATDPEIQREATANLCLRFRTPPAAYVMYTSGSTGTPKGVVIPHRGVIRLVINNGYAQIEPTDCFAHYSNPTFDASTFEIWAALLHGARVVIVPQSVVLDGPRFAATLQQAGVTMLYMSVGLFNEYADTLAATFARLRYLMVGGDALDPESIRRVLSASPPHHLLNVYGPTECTTYSTAHLIQTVELGVKNIPIGKPISNTRVYILDAHLRPVPVGVTGELHIGGVGVADGYLNQPELTAERFPRDPFSVESHARIYKTGDLGRWRSDGTIEYLGRNDHQVKVRGYRIELGEIEAQLVRHPQVKEAVVLARNSVPGNKLLVAYVIPARPEHSPRPEELRAHVESLLPQYMVPSAIVLLEHLPLTRNGKLDRLALPAPELAAYVHRAYEPPLGETETTVAALWRELLQIERVGRQDNFFDLGGHSLSAMQLMSRIQAWFSIDAPVRMLFECSTLSKLAERVEQLRGEYLLDRLMKGSAESDELFESVASMTEGRVEELLKKLTTERRT